MSYRHLHPHPFGLLSFWRHCLKCSANGVASVLKRNHYCFTKVHAAGFRLWPRYRWRLQKFQGGNNWSFPPSPQHKTYRPVTAVFGSLRDLNSSNCPCAMATCHSNPTLHHRYIVGCHHRFVVLCEGYTLAKPGCVAPVPFLISSLHVKRKTSSNLAVRLSLNLGNNYSFHFTQISPKDSAFSPTKNTRENWPPRPFDTNIFPRLYSASGSFEANFSLFNFLNTSQRTHVVLHRQPREGTSRQEGIPQRRQWKQI